MSKVFIFILSIIILTACSSEEEIVIPKAETVIFIDMDSIQFKNISKDDSPNLDLIVRSGTELIVDNPDSLMGYQLLNLSADSEFIDIVNKYLRSSNNFYLNESSDSLTLFDEAANIFSNNDATFIYLNAGMYADSLNLFDDDFASLLDEINYSAKFDKAILVLMFNNGIDNKAQLKVVVNGPKIRKGTEVEGIVEPIDVNTSVLNSMEISLPEDWPGKKIEFLFLKDYRD